MHISRDTWILLHYNMAAVYVGLGAVAVVWPRRVARFFYLPYSTPQSLHAGDVETITPGIGLRDITIGLILYACLAKGDYDMATTVVFAGQIPMVYDSLVAFRNHGFVRGCVIAFGSASWGLTAYGLKYWS